MLAAEHCFYYDLNSWRGTSYNKVVLKDDNNNIVRHDVDGDKNTKDAVKMLTGCSSSLHNKWDTITMIIIIKMNWLRDDILAIYPNEVESSRTPPQHQTPCLIGDCLLFSF